MFIAHDLFQGDFLSEVSCQEPHRILIQCKGDGVVQSLSSSWLLTPLSENTCEIAFELSVQLDNFLFNMILSQSIDKLGKSMIEAFERRVRQLNEKEKNVSFIEKPSL